MRTTLISAFAICLFASPTLHDAFLRQKPPESAVLAFAPRPRQTLSYSFLSRMNSEGQGFLGKSLTLTAQAEGTVDFFIRQASTESVFADLSSQGIRVFLQSLGRQDEFKLSSPADNPVRIVFDRAGRIRDIQNAESLEEQNIMNFSIVEVLRNSLPSFPDRPVARGDSWTDHKRLFFPFQGMRLAVDIQVTFNLVDISPAGEGRTALVSAVYTVSLAGSRNFEGVVGAFQGKGSGSGSLVFLVDEGHFTEYRLDYTIDGAMVLRKADSPLVEWPFSLSVTAELLLLEKRQTLFP
jgi:hypothetical protein